MIRWLAVVCLLAAPAGAQVFKPKSGSSSTSKSSKSSSAHKATAHKATSHKAKHRSRAASKGRPSDLTPEDAPKVDPDYVKIIDDDE